MSDLKTFDDDLVQEAVESSLVSVLHTITKL